MRCFNLAGPIPPIYRELEVKSFKMDWLHLVCRSHVQSGSLELNDMLADLTNNYPRNPMQPRLNLRHQIALGFLWCISVTSSNILSS